ncbi:hypothetical protein [Micromonospora rubida]|nr:hypothetical protein [Micromonospora rubida]NBE83940.1 hypothetical protein [Micromonospora rubida]
MSGRATGPGGVPPAGPARSAGGGMGEWTARPGAGRCGDGGERGEAS